MPLDEYAVAVLGPETDTTDFATQNFIALGGDSLRAMRLAALVQERLNIRLPVAALLGAAPLAEVFAEFGVAAAPASHGATPETTADSLSHAQRGMWMIERVTGGSPYNLVFTCLVETGSLDLETFRKAVAATVARHRGLRTVYRGRDDDVEPVVLTSHTAQITAVEHDGDEAEFGGFVRRMASEQGRLPFDLAAAPAFRFLYITHPAGRQAIALLAHHMVLDGWAVGLLLKEVLARHDALSRGVPAPFSGAAASIEAVLRRQRADRASGEWDKQAEFWVTHTDGVPSVLDLPADRQRPAIQDPSGERVWLDLGDSASGTVADRARELGITPFAFLLGAFALTLSRWTGARSLLIGVPLLGRSTPELAELIAVAGNLVPVRVDVDDDATTADFLRAVARSLARSIDAGALPFEELVARLGIERSHGCHPLVQVCFGMHDQLIPQRIRTGTVTVRVEEGHGGGAQFDLSLLIGRSEPSLAGQLEYATGVWCRAEAQGFVADFKAAAGQLATAGDTPLEQVRCLSTERRAVLEAINQTRRDFPATSLDELFRAVAAATPDAVAVREGDTELTYAQLAEAAAGQARLLREAGVRPGDRVLVGLERSVAEAVAVLGTVWAGAAYVGVDLNAPAAHTDKILAKATPTAALVAPAAADYVARQGIPVVPAWEPARESSGEPARQPAWESSAEPTRQPAGEPGALGAPGETLAPDPGRLAYVAFTSGSTGEPKGVSVPHRAVIRLVHEPDYVRLGAGERMLRLSPLAFDASTLEIWGALLNGATLEVHPAGLPSPSELGRFLLERGVTVAWLTAGLFRLVEEFAPASFRGLRQLLTGGDVVPHGHAARVLERHPGLEITNGYGPTENTTFTTTHTVASPGQIDGPLPIGTPVPGTTVYVLDDRRRLVPPGAVGELYTGGAGLADGYLGDEAETARSFGHFSPDVPQRLYRTGDLVRIDTAGRLRFLGRRDDQVKLRGYRVELSAINSALTSNPRVGDAMVLVTDGDSAEKRLLAAVVPAAGATVSPPELRDLLAQRLPSYMVPTLWAVVDRIPVTGNGKVDRRALAAIAAPAGQSPRPTAQPRTDDGVLARISAVFAEAIGDTGTEFGADTDFFTVGGNSMGAVRLVRLVKDRLGVTMRLRDFLLSPTPAGMRLLIERAQSG
jgi:amino acid adenylation domain-containing protein